METQKQVLLARKEELEKSLKEISEHEGNMIAGGVAVAGFVGIYSYIKLRPLFILIVVGLVIGVLAGLNPMLKNNNDKRAEIKKELSEIDVQLAGENQEPLEVKKELDKLKTWISSLKKKGKTVKQIEDILINKGLEKDQAKKILRELHG